MCFVLCCRVFPWTYHVIRFRLLYPVLLSFVSLFLYFDMVSFRVWFVYSLFRQFRDGMVLGPYKSDLTPPHIFHVFVQSHKICWVIFVCVLLNSIYSSLILLSKLVSVDFLQDFVVGLLDVDPACWRSCRVWHQYLIPSIAT